MTAAFKESARLHKNKLKGLYAITDEKLITGKNFNTAIESALQGGASIIQYRDKSNNHKKRFQQASTLKSLCKQYNAVCLINDDLELAKKISADGIHLGKNDIAISEARKTLGENAIIGISCYNDFQLAISAKNNTADYVAFGAMFSSSTKPEAINADIKLISEAKHKLAIPVCAIGGITEKNIQQLIQQGADMTAVINGLFAANDIKRAASKFSNFFN